ncbi:MAG: glycosyltransferase [Candidatus Falkowbacteria bacterium]
MPSSKKTILYLITQSELGGAQKYIYDLARSLKDEFNIAVAYGKQGHGGELAQKLRQIGVDNFAVPGLKREISPLSDLTALVNIIKIIRRLKPDIIHLNSSKISILGSIAGIFAPKSAIIYTAHGWVFNEPERNHGKYRCLEKFTAKFKDKIICVSEFDRLAAIREKIAPESKLITIHNGVEPINFLSPEEARARLISICPAPEEGANKGFMINPKDFIIGSIGNLYKTKGFEHLISAVKILISNGIRIKTVIIGEGPERSELNSWIERLRLTDHVLLAGRIDNSAELLRAFDIYACSSVKEGLSYTIIEAMLAGLPIVATRVGGNGELIGHKKEGFLVGHKNAESLARGIIETMDRPGFKEKIGVAARAKALSEFTLENMVERTKAVYYSLL